MAVTVIVGIGRANLKLLGNGKSVKSVAAIGAYTKATTVVRAAEGLSQTTTSSALRVSKIRATPWSIYDGSGLKTLDANSVLKGNAVGNFLPFPITNDSYLNPYMDSDLSIVSRPSGFAPVATNDINIALLTAGVNLYASFGGKDKPTNLSFGQIKDNIL